MDAIYGGIGVLAIFGMFYGMVAWTNYWIKRVDRNDT